MEYSARPATNEQEKRQCQQNPQARQDATHNADGGLDLLGVGAHHGTEDGRTRDATVHHVIDVIRLEREHLAAGSKHDTVSVAEQSR